LKAKPDGQNRGASQRNDGKVARRLIGGESRREVRRRTGRLIQDASRRSDRKHSRRTQRPGSRKSGSPGRAGRLVGDASRRLAGGQRRRDSAAGEVEVAPQAGPEGESETQVEDEPEGSAIGIHQTISVGGWSAGRAGRLIGGDGRRLARGQRQRMRSPARVGGWVCRQSWKVDQETQVN